MKFIVDGVEKQITLRVWSSKDHDWMFGGADMLPDLDPDHTEGEELTAEEYEYLAAFWEYEVGRHNDGLPSFFTEDMAEYEREDYFDEHWHEEFRLDVWH